MPPPSEQATLVKWRENGSCELSQDHVDICILIWKIRTKVGRTQARFLESRQAQELSSLFEGEQFEIK